LKNRSEFLKLAIKVAKEAGKIQMSHFGNISSLEKKSTNYDLLTEADKKSENHIIKQISLKYPQHSILSEERGETNNTSEYKWIIDPLDGTTNFVHNLPIFAVSIGLQLKNDTICAVVYNPAADKCFYAEKDKGAYLNDTKLSVSSSFTLSDSLIVTGFPYLHDIRYDLSFEIFKELYGKTRGIRRLGAAALDLCFVAMGRFDAFYEFELKPWDICAGSLIVSEAGGIVSDWNGLKVPDSGIRILASNNKVHNEIIEVLKSEKYRIFY
jgi:myo-inositol-1(or 4)-monophosphatase